MNVWSWVYLKAFLTVGLFLQASLTAAGIRHQDFRSPHYRLLLPEAGEAFLDTRGGRESALRAFLASRHLELGEVAAAADSLPLLSVRRSLLGEHYHFQQFWAGHPVVGAGILVSVSLSGRVYRVINNFYPVPPGTRVPVSARDAEQALEAAWQHLRVHGPLADSPRAELVWLPGQDSFRLVYRTDIAVQAPLGHWQHDIDAGSGEVLGWRDLRMHKRRLPVPDFSRYSGPIRDRAEAQSAYQNRLVSKTAGAGDGAVVEGSALVFDPDPPTTLMRSDLDFDTPDPVFEPAYVTRPLAAQTLLGNEYRLQGPWIELVDFEAPIVPPSLNPAADWTARRGTSAFTDVMTYFHIDRNQRYVQSLGYTGETGIYQRPVKVDSDALNGLDQSAWDASSQVLLFGHGCVPDNEDPTVLLHEYSHALQWDSNGVGVPGLHDDLGAISEGLSDYWAGSYRFGTPQGQAFEPAWVFPWDGHNSCWEGRFLDRTRLRYDPSKEYPSHEEILDGSQRFAGFSEELWSTPLFQSLLALDSLGLPREELDRIILEAQFGLSNGIRMREAALIVLDAAGRLEPLGPHVDILEEKFRDQNILPADGPAEDHVLWFPYAKTEAGSFTGVALANFSTRAISGRLTAYDRDGKIVSFPENPSLFSLPAREQSARLAEEIFAVPKPTGEPVWFELRGDSPRLGTFFQVGSNQLEKLDGSVPLNRQDTRIILNRVFDGPGSYRGRLARTRVSVVNPNPDPISIDMSLVRPGPPGRMVPNPRLIRQLPGHGFLHGTVQELFDLDVPVSLGYIDIRVTSGAGAIAFELIELEEVGTLIGLNGGFVSPEKEAFSAQLASTPDLFSSLNLINTRQDFLPVRLRVIGEDGEEMFAPVERVLNPGEQWSQDVREIFLPSIPLGNTPETSFVGSLRVESEAPGLLGDIIFGDRLEDQFAAGLLLQHQLFTHGIFSHLANRLDLFTGLAFHLPGERDAEVTIEVFSALGTPLGRTTQLFSGGQRISRLVEELVPESAGAAGGYILVESTEPLVAQMLFAAIVSGTIRQFSAVPPTLVADSPNRRLRGSRP